MSKKFCVFRFSCADSENINIFYGGSVLIKAWYLNFKNSANTNGYQTPDETTPVATEFANDIHNAKPSSSSSSLYPQSNNRLLYPNLPRLQPSGSTSTTTPSSTCSSPVSHHLLSDLSGPSHMPLTPPQSAPPQKMTTSFFSDRMRSKSTAHVFIDK